MRNLIKNLNLGKATLIVLGLMLSACDSTGEVAHSLYAAPCHPPTVEGNVYRQEVQPILDSYYQQAFSNPNDLQLYQSMQYEAIRLLATQTERWSDSIDISLEAKFVRITVTYLSPKLVQTIILNHYLYRRHYTPTNGSFDADVLSQMENIANRNEHLFFVTLTASTYEQATSFGDHVIIHLPMQSMVLTNSSNTQVIPQHDDHNLEERIDLTFGPAYGYFSLPMAITINGNCEFLLDKVNNARLILSIPHISVNGTNYTTKPWTIDYAPPLGIALDPNPIEDRLLLERTTDHFSPDKEPPVSITPVDAEYWEKLARFIWHEMTLDP